MDKNGKYMGLRFFGQMTIETRSFKDDNGNYYEISIGSVCKDSRDRDTIFNVCGYAIDYISQNDSHAQIELNPVRHGRWVDNTFCSECNRFPVDVSVSISNQELTKYFSRCPHCGAKMDGGVNNGNETNSGTKSD